MKANELRIGNFVYHNYEIIEIKSLHLKDDDVNDEMPFHAIYGIKLTEEWLLKFGFKEIKNEPQQWFKIKTKKKGVNLEISLKQKRVILFKHNGYYSDCIYPKYVHQLQNLYFALTHDELKIK